MKYPKEFYPSTPIIFLPNNEDELRTFYHSVNPHCLHLVSTPEVCGSECISAFLGKPLVKTKSQSKGIPFEYRCSNRKCRKRYRSRPDIFFKINATFHQCNAALHMFINGDSSQCIRNCTGLSDKQVQDLKLKFQATIVSGIENVTYYLYASLLLLFFDTSYNEFLCFFL